MIWSALFVGLVAIFAGVALYRHVVGIEALMRGVHLGLGVIPVRWLDAMRRFNIVSLRVVAVVWIELGCVAIVTTLLKFVTE